MKKIFVDSARLFDCLLDSQMTLRAAAAKCGLCRDQMTRLLKADRQISLRTAGLLKKNFGANVVKILED